MAEALTYRQTGDYLIPNLTLPETRPIGKYGMMRLTYLKNSRRSLYSALMITGKLTEHLEETDRTAREQIQTIVGKMAKTEGITEVMKAKDPQRWTGLMNNLRHSAEEIVLPEVIFS